jgi:hypothetical protein
VTTAPWPVSNIDQLAPIRVAKQSVLPPRPDIARPSSAQLTEAINTIAATGWVAEFEPNRPYAMRIARGAHPGGRKPEMTLMALFVGCLLLTMMERPFIIRDVARLLNEGIDAGSRKRLGLPMKRPITEKMVSDLFNFVAARINPSIYFESNAWLLDDVRVRESIGLAPDADLDPIDHARFINEHLDDNAERLENFIRAGLRSTHPTDSEHDGDYSIDGSFIPSWERGKTSRRRTFYKLIDPAAEGWTHIKRKEKKQAPPKGDRKVPRPGELADPDASWWSKKNDGPVAQKGSHAGTSDSGLGYILNAITWAERDMGPNKRGPDIPILIEHLSVRTGRAYPTKEGAALTERMVAHHEAEDEAAHRPLRTRGDILADREYSRVADWQKRMHDAGFTPHFNLAQEQRGHTSTLGSGALVIDGLAYSPGIPMNLRGTMIPPAFATRQDRAWGAAYFAQLAPYRIRVDGRGRADDGSLKVYCPASNQAKASLICANKPASLEGKMTRLQIGTALPIIGAAHLPSICTQSTVTIAFDELPFWQPHIPGTPEHQWSINRRNTVESAFSRIKDEASQSMRRGQVRLMGKAKMSMGALFFAMAANLVEVTRWRLRQAGVFSLDAAREVKTRVPRRHTRARIAAAERRENLRIKRELIAAGLDPDTTTVDLETGEVIQSQNPPPTR